MPFMHLPTQFPQNVPIILYFDFRESGERSGQLQFVGRQ